MKVLMVEGIVASTQFYGSEPRILNARKRRRMEVFDMNCLIKDHSGT